jgi:hypothetical protein
VIEWFFLDWVDTETGRAAIGGEDDLVVLTHAHEAGTTLSLVQFAVAWTKVTLYSAII